MGVAAFCSACGAALTTSSGYCSACGAPVQAAGTSSIPAQPPHQTVTVGPSVNPLACPRYREVDQSSKISSVVRKEVTTGAVGGSFAGGAYQFGKYGGLSLMGGGIHLSTQSLTALGRMLAPPVPPAYRSPWRFGIVLGILILVIAGLSLLGSEQTQGAGAVPLGLICLGVAGAIIIGRMRLAARRKRAYAEALPQWEHAARRWDEMYVCLRCDAIYTPGSSDIYRAEHLQQVIYGT